MSRDWIVYTTGRDGVSHPTLQRTFPTEEAATAYVVELAPMFSKACYHIARLVGSASVNYKPTVEIKRV